MVGPNKRSIALVQQGVWATPKESMPLAAGYLKAAALDDDRIRADAAIEIFNFRGGETVAAMAHRLFAAGVPDVLACSVLGWNFRSFSLLAETFRRLNPSGWIVFGGNHVANQGERVFRLVPEVDVIANGEGELVFAELLRAYLGGRPRDELHSIRGISFRDPDGTLVTTEDRERLTDLDTIPSPFLTGAIRMTDERGRFPYDVALMETNRGCPYKCAFCYWGGAIGQKVRRFSRDRLRAELELFGAHGVDTVVLCDANFGMLKTDADFLEDVIATRERFGYPRAIETSWAKNKTRIFYAIVQRMRETGLRSSFTLALQSLDEATLEAMRRRNMRLNDWEDLVEWLDGEGLDCYAELIWGAPGETPESFLAGYDRLARHVPRIATYPLLVLPNTAYSEQRDAHELVTVRGDRDDFEYVLAHRTMTIEENMTMHRFLFWARTVGESMFFRAIWRPLRDLAGLTQSEVLLDLADWVDATDRPAAIPLKAGRGPLVDSETVSLALRYLHATPAVRDLFDAWWRESIVPILPPQAADFLTEAFRYDLLTLPVYDQPEEAAVGLEVVDVDGQHFYRRPDVRFDYDVAAVVGAMKQGTEWDLAPSPCVVSFYYLSGFYAHLDSHEVAAHYFGRPETEVFGRRSARAA